MEEKKSAIFSLPLLNHHVKKGFINFREKFGATHRQTARLAFANGKVYTTPRYYCREEVDGFRPHLCEELCLHENNSTTRC